MASNGKISSRNSIVVYPARASEKIGTEIQATMVTQWWVHLMMTQVGARTAAAMSDTAGKAYSYVTYGKMRKQGVLTGNCGKIRGRFRGIPSRIETHV